MNKKIMIGILVSLALLLFGCGGQTEQTSEPTTETSTEAVTETETAAETSESTTTVTVTETTEETITEETSEAATEETAVETEEETVAEATPSIIEVEIRDYAFDEETITVKAGDTLVWKNYDSAPHTVTATSGADFDSGKMSRDDTWEYTFTEPGTYEYYCSYHPSMVGKVIVE